MTLKQWVIDAFADAPFEGNPAAVVPLKAWLDDALMQRIAAENNLSETAFFVETAAGRYGLRWFTPASEVDLCGHATLATAHVVFNHVAPGLEGVTFDTRSGPLVVTRAGGDLMTMDFPAIHATVPEGAAEIGAKVAAIMGCPVPAEVFTAPDLMIVLEDAAAVRALSPQAGLGPLLSEVKMRGLIATAPSDDARFDFVSRFFAPNHGIPEDPVTGSAHCKLMPYWAKRLGRTKLTARQVSPRGGTLICELKGERVTLTGRCEAFLEGVLNVGGA